MKHYSDQLQSNTSQLLRARAVILHFFARVRLKVSIRRYSLLIGVIMGTFAFSLFFRELQIDSTVFTRSMGTTDECLGLKPRAL